jgi:hypothetical protein
VQKTAERAQYSSEKRGDESWQTHLQSSAVHAVHEEVHRHIELGLHVLRQQRAILGHQRRQELSDRRRLVQPLLEIALLHHSMVSSQTGLLGHMSV